MVKHARKLLELMAANQQGYFTSQQAKDAGYAQPVHVYHVQQGNWLHVDRGIFRLPGYADTLISEFIKWSLWAIGRSAERQVVISHDCALQYYGLNEAYQREVHLIVPLNIFVKDEKIGCIFHREELSQNEFMPKGGFNITTPQRTLIDMRSKLILQTRWLSSVYQALSKGLIDKHIAGMLLGDFGDPRFQNPILIWTGKSKTRETHMNKSCSASGDTTAQLYCQAIQSFTDHSLEKKINLYHLRKLLEVKITDADDTHERLMLGKDRKPEWLTIARLAATKSQCYWGLAEDYSISALMERVEPVYRLDEIAMSAIFRGGIRLKEKQSIKAVDDFILAIKLLEQASKIRKPVIYFFFSIQYLCDVISELAKNLSHKDFLRLLKELDPFPPPPSVFELLGDCALQSRNELELLRAHKLPNDVMLIKDEISEPPTEEASALNLADAESVQQYLEVDAQKLKDSQLFGDELVRELEKLYPENPNVQKVLRPCTNLEYRVKIARTNCLLLKNGLQIMCGSISTGAVDPQTNQVVEYTKTNKGFILSLDCIKLEFRD